MSGPKGFNPFGERDQFGGVNPNDVAAAQAELDHPSPSIFRGVGPNMTAGEALGAVAAPPPPNGGFVGVLADPPDVEDTLSPGTPGDMSSADDQQAALKARMLDEMSNNGAPQAPKAFYAPGGEDFTQMAGRRGKELFMKAYGDGPDDGPTKLANAVRDSQKAQEQRADELSKSYDQESQRATQAMAARRMSLQQDQQELQQRQQNLQMASQQYTNDLADQGKFWTNPGNIIAAISFSLMPIFSNDPTVGVKLVNQAIQQDLDNRRQNAQGALGALRSNLDGYYKLAGDRQAGDQLAEAEAHRVAALDVERIMAKFESPISKAKGEAIIQSLNVDTAKGYMQSYAQAKIFQPAHVADPNLFNMRTKGYDGAFAPINGPDVAPVQTVGAAVKGDVNGSPTLAGPKFSNNVDPNVQMVLNNGAPISVAAKLALSGRIPDSEDLQVLKSRYLNSTATALTAGQGPNAFTRKKADLQQDANKELKETSGLVLGPNSIAGRKATLSDVLSTAQVIKASEAAHGRSSADFLGSLRQVIGSDYANRWEQLERTFQSKDGLSPAAARMRVMDQAKQAFRQKVAMQISEDYHDLSGGAISPSELPRLQAFVDNGSDFNFVVNWLNHRAIAVQAKENAVVGGLTPLAQIQYMAQFGVGIRPMGVNIRPTAGPVKPKGPNFIGPTK